RFFFASRRRHTRWPRDWSSDVCSSDLGSPGISNRRCSLGCTHPAGGGYRAQQVLKKICEIGVGFSFAALSVFRPRRAEAVSALWIPHWHSEPFESQGARAAKRWT